MGYSIYTTTDPIFRGQVREESDLSNRESGDRLEYLFIILSIWSLSCDAGLRMLIYYKFLHMVSLI